MRRHVRKGGGGYQAECYVNELVVQLCRAATWSFSRDPHRCSLDREVRVAGECGGRAIGSFKANIFILMLVQWPGIKALMQHYRETDR